MGEPIIVRLAAGARFKRGPRRTRSQLAQITLQDRIVSLALPTTYMNESGGPVVALLDYFDLEPESLVVAHDDIDLPFGRIRFQFDRGPGGHNGVTSVVKSLGSRGFWRLKFGVGRPPGRMDPADYVLRRFAASERGDVESMVVEAADVLRVFAESGGDAAQQEAAEATRRLGISE